MALTNPRSSSSGYSAEMDEAERASRDEIIALQTKRMAWTLAHAYDNVAHYRTAFDKAGVKPATSGNWPTSRNSRSRSRPTCATITRSTCSLCRAKNWSGSTPPPAPRQADRGRLYPSRYRHVVRRDGPLDPRRGRPHRHDHPQRLWLWPVHRRARRALRRGKARLHRGAGFRRHDRAASAADQRFQTRHHHGDAELHAGDPGRVQDARASTRASPR